MDHVDANPSKGAGKQPRVSRATRTSKHSYPEEANSGFAVKRKIQNREEHKPKSSKLIRLDHHANQTSASSKGSTKAHHGSGVRKGHSDVALTNSSFATRQLRNHTSKQDVFIPSALREGSDSSSSDSDEEIATTDSEARALDPPTPPPPTESSSSATTNTKRSGKGTKGSTAEAAGSCSANSKGGRHSSRFAGASTSVTLSNLRSQPGKCTKVKGRPSGIPIPSTTTSEEEAKGETASNSDIVSRLRLTPSRAAAASQQRALLAASAAGSSSPTTSKGKPGRSAKPFRFPKKKQRTNAVTTAETSTSNPPTTTNTDTEDQDDSSAPGPSSKSKAHYQLRSRASVDSPPGTKEKSGKDKSKKSSPQPSASAGSSNSSSLRSAHILSEKEKNLRRRNQGPSSGSCSHSNSGPSSSSSTCTHNRPTGPGGRSAPANSFTTGSCTSSRCGRGGGPSSEASGSLASSSKPGEPGMNNQASGGGQSSSGQGTSSSAAAGAAEGAAGSSSVTAASAASAFSRSLAMLTGDPEGDDGEMGRLQALLEARGLPSHLFGSLAPRMQQLLNRGMSNSTVTKAQQLLQGLQSSGDEGQQLQAAIEMCQLLVMGNEDTLAGFPVKQTVPALITLLSMDHNFDMMNHACRALTYMMEALPRSTPIVIEAVPVFLEKLQVIQCMDVAEQSLTALEMLSRRHAKTILQARGVSACLTYLDFFSITAQRAALSITANCCQGVLADEFHLVADSLGFLASRLTQQDKKSVESVCLTFSRLVDSFPNDPKRLEEISSADLLANLQQLLVVTPPVVSTGTFILVLRMLAQICARSPAIAAKLLQQNIVGTLSSLLLGSTSVNADGVSDEVELVPRNPQELLEIVSLIAELLPKLPREGIFMVNTMMTHPHLTCQDAIQWQWRDDRGLWNSYSPFDSRIIEAAHQSGEDEISLTLQARTYTVDFLGMQQINEDTGTARTVQRKLNPFYNSRVAESKKAAGAGETGEKENPDVRTAYLSAHPDFALPFLRPLFALLSEANSSSAGPAVRQSCLKTLLRIVHYMPPESLQKTLKPQQVSNNLASMLGSSDLKIVVGAFQLSSLMMEKLYDTFVVHFRREGVFHQISRISTSDVVGPSPIKSEIAALLGGFPAAAATGNSAAGSSAAVPQSTVSIPTTFSTSNTPPLSMPYVSIPNPFALHGKGSAPSSSATIQVPADSVSGGLSMPSLTTVPIPIPPSVPMQSMYNPSSSPLGLGLCVGGFFMQPGAAAPVAASSAPVTRASALDNQEASVLMHLPPSSALMNLSLSTSAPSSGTGGTDSSSSASAATSIANTSSDSANEASTPTAGSKLSSSGSASSSGEKRPEENPTLLSDAFKRKRISKRQIPTSTPNRRLRQDDPGAATVISPTSAGAAAASCVIQDLMSHQSRSSTAAAASSTAVPAQPTRRGGKSTGFFASLHPSRWARGGSSSSSSTSANNNNATATSTERSQASAAATSGSGATAASGSSSSTSRGHSANAYMAISYKEQAKSWLKEQSLLFSQKYCRNNSGDTFAAVPGGASAGYDTSVGILPKLGEIVADLRKEDKVVGALKELRTIVVESDISSFEVNHSGLIGALLKFLVDEVGYSSSRDKRLRSFIHVFADAPLDELSGEELEPCATSQKLAGGNSALSLLVSKLNSCFSQLEQFQVKVHEVPTTSGSSRVAPSSALRFFNTHQLKCVLQRHPSCTSLRQWKGGPVKIDPLALVQAIERYLLVRGFGRVRESRDSGDSDDDNSDDDIDDSLAAVIVSQGSARHKLQFMIGDHVLPYNMTVYQAIRQFGTPIGEAGGDLEADFDPTSTLLGSSSTWAQTHTIHYRPLPEDGSHPAPAVPKTSSKKKTKSPTVKSSSKSKKDPIWHEGIVAVPTPPYLSYLASRLPESVTISDPSLAVLTLLRVIHAVCRFWRSLYWPVLPGAPLLPVSEFINTKVAAKAQRQLQDPVVIMTGNVPQWLQQIGVVCPFLFPFETRQMLFYSISFDRDRALQRLLDSVPELASSEREVRDRVTPRLDRRKRTISRDQILAQAEQLMQDFSSSRPLLEIQYENEVGTGLGPTLEFYALVSQELQKKELDLWHSESSHSHHSIDEDALDIKAKSYIQTSVGLFPKPLGKSVKANHLAKVKSKFKFLGRFMAKAVMDSRMLDLPLSKTQYKWILGCESSLCLGDIVDVDSAVGQSIKKLVSVVSNKKRLELKSGLNGAELTAALEALTLDGCRIDNLGLDFTLPGHPSIELRKGGKDIPVTVHNLEDYIKLVCHWILVGGVSRQMESWREGFDSVFQSSSLRMFYPEELEMIFCGANQSVGENWNVKTLTDCCRPDHGFTHESRAIQFLFEVMSSYDAQERRKFVQFVTGSPRLPVGGFKALQPPLTVVRKTIEAPADADAFLPSVMTCVNYLKLPDYSTLQIMRDRLKVAAEEGQMSFHLS